MEKVREADSESSGSSRHICSESSHFLPAVLNIIKKKSINKACSQGSEYVQARVPHENSMEELKQRTDAV